MKIHSIVNYGVLAISSLLFAGLAGCSKEQQSGNDLGRQGMIVDRLERAETYFDLHPGFERAFAFLRQENLAGLAPGRHEIDGDRMFCLISNGPGRTREEAKLEAHRKYIDIQYVIAGTDEMGWKPAAECRVQDAAYDAEKDIEFFKDEPREWKPVPAGSFTIFFPEDAHAPLVSEGNIHKVVLKIKVMSDDEPEMEPSAESDVT